MTEDRPEGQAALAGVAAHTGGHATKWIIRARPKTNRIACPWLITRFIDRDGEIIYVRGL
jgi:hypothetical protein